MSDVRSFLRLPDSDPSRILGVPGGASLKDIKAAYVRLVEKWHPYLVEEPKKKALLMQANNKIREAYALLIQPFKK